MQLSNAARFLDTADRRLSERDRRLLEKLHTYTRHRLESAQRAGEEARRDTSQERTQRDLHRFLQECFGALDGLAREINLCMYRRFPEAGLYPPHSLARQCGLYMVRKILHESPNTASHPVSHLLWGRTRDPADEAYRRLSFLYNLSLFLPLPLPEGGTMLPGSADLPRWARPFARDEKVEACALDDGVDRMLGWTKDFGGHCCAELTRVLEDT